MSEDRSQRSKWRLPIHEPEWVRAAGSRRKVLARAGLIVVLLVVFVFAPGYLATRPRYMQRYVGTDHAYDTWSKSVHASVSCQRCHISPKPVAQLGYDVRMLGEFYLSVVSASRQPALFAKPTNAACQSCHIDLRTVSPSGDLNIPHRAHVNVLKLQCIECHKYLVHALNPEGNHRPRMVTCLKCHDGKTAKSQCSACHTSKQEPLDHRSPDWVVVHPQRQNAENCQKCHKWTTNWCAKCHTKRPRSHGADWRTKHKFQVQKHRNCEACHKADFCARCHGELPTQNLNPNLKLVTR